MWGVNVVTCKIQALLSMCTVRFFSILGLYISFLCTKTEVEPFCSFVFGFFSFFFLRCLFMPMLSVVPVCQCDMRCSKVAEI